MGAKLVHTLNEAWLKIELKRIADKKIDWLLLAICEKETDEVNNLLAKLAKEIFQNDDSCTEVSHAEADNMIAEIIAKKNERGLVTIVTEEWFKRFKRFPRTGYDSFLISHDVTDVFFKSEVSKNCGLGEVDARE